MEKLYGVQELAERWRCSERTARERMRRIGILGRPMMCRESDIEAWEKASVTYMKETPEAWRRRIKREYMEEQMGYAKPKPGQLISRVRPTIAK